MEKSITVDALVKQVHQLISLPEIYFKIEKMIESGKHSNQEIGRIISQDPALTLRLLQIVNSALFNYGGRIDTVSRAVTLVGHNELKMLIVASAVVNIFDKFPSRFVDAMQLWRKSLLTGIIARILAKKCHVLHPERLFIAGLLHDIGHLVIYSQLEKQTEQILSLSDAQASDLNRDVNSNVNRDVKRSINRIEQQVLGFDYTDVNFQLAHDWRFPESLQISLKFHDDPSQAKAFQLETALVHIAKAIAAIEDEEDPINNTSPYAWQVCGLDITMIEEVQIEAGVQFSEALELILPQ